MRGVRVCVRWHLCWMCLLRSIEDLQFQTPFLFLSCFFCSFYITYSQIPFSFSSQLLHKSRYSHPSLSLCYQYLIHIYIYHIIDSQTVLTSSLIPLFSSFSFTPTLLLTRITVFLNLLSYLHWLTSSIPYFSPFLFSLFVPSLLLF